MAPRRSGLGRGLDALIPAGEEERDRPSGQRTAAIDEISLNPGQPRAEFDDEALRELADSIAQLGILQPLLVREVGDGLQLIAGERRLRAAGIAGLKEVPVMVVDTDDRGSLERALVENIHREDLNPIEEAAAYRQLLDDAGHTHEALADRLGRSRVAITNALRLLDLPAPVQRFLVEGSLSAAHGRALLGLQSSPFQERLARRVASEKISVRETEELVRKFQAMTEGTTRRTGGTAQRPAEIAESQRVLTDHLQTRVRVDMGKRKGKIVIDFVSLEELERVMAAIVGSGERRGATRVTPE